MAAPFLDLGLIESALEGLRADGTLASLRVLGRLERADPALAARPMPALLIVPQETAVTGPAGNGIDSIVTEVLGLLIQVRHAGGNDAVAGASIGAIRAAVFSALAGLRPAGGWSPLLYQGGSMLGIDDQVFSWREVYSTQTGSSVIPWSP